MNFPHSGKNFFPLINKKTKATRQGTTMPTGPFVSAAPPIKRMASQGMPFRFRSYQKYS